ncbi:MAG: glycoside hydrolase family 127 protein, partial [Bacteroidales bacterium]|nr:glycoside hydrolase family 127 protein [Bacteroidales bacterium]
TGDSALRDSIELGVKGILASQLPNGYIGNYPEGAQLHHWDIWGRKHTMGGLLTWYEQTGDKKLLDACRKLADHLMTQVGPGKTDIVATSLFFGMASSTILEPMVLLYRYTGDSRYLDFARYIVNQWETEKGPRLLSKAQENIPIADRFPHPLTLKKGWFSEYNGEKAYEMMACYEGLLELYRTTNNLEYLSAVEKTACNIIDTEINIAGSGTAYEGWYHGKTMQTRLTYATMELCSTVTWMKLCQALLSITGNPLYADQIEKTAYNALLASMKEDASHILSFNPLEGHREPGVSAFGMHVNGQKGSYLNCCNANAPRAFALLPQFAVMQADNKIIVNLYTDLSATVMPDKKKKVSLQQQTDYPRDGIIRIQVDPDKPAPFEVLLRIPAWSRENAVTVNGDTLRGVTSGTYYSINRTWKKGDVIELQLDVRARIVRENGYAALVKGPVALARDTRFADGFVDEAARIREKDGYVELIPAANKPGKIWMAFTAPLVLGSTYEGGKPKQVHFCDFPSAGNTWEPDVRYKVWIPEPVNVMNTIHKH